MSKGKDAGSECATCGLKCCICCFWFLEKFIRYLNHNAYTVIAIESINFCPAAGVVSFIDFLNFLAHIYFVNGVKAYLILEYFSKYNHRVSETGQDNRSEFYLDLPSYVHESSERCEPQFL